MSEQAVVETEEKQEATGPMVGTMAAPERNEAKECDFDPAKETQVVRERLEKMVVRHEKGIVNARAALGLLDQDPDLMEKIHVLKHGLEVM